MGLNTIKGTGNWGGAASDLNNNFATITADIEKLKAANVKFKGYYTTELTLKAAHPSPTVGDNAWVGAEYPGTVYECKTAGTWSNTAKAPSTPSVQLADYATKTLVDVRTTEYNVSVQHPTSGLDGTNKYTLSGAIALIPAALRSVGLKCSFLNVDGKMETWEYQGGTFTDVSRWVQQIQRAELLITNRKILAKNARDLNDLMQYSLKGVTLEDNSGNILKNYPNTRVVFLSVKKNEVIELSTSIRNMIHYYDSNFVRVGGNTEGSDKIIIPENDNICFVGFAHDIAGEIKITNTIYSYVDKSLIDIENNSVQHHYSDSLNMSKGKYAGINKLPFAEFDTLPIGAVINNLTTSYDKSTNPRLSKALFATITNRGNASYYYVDVKLEGLTVGDTIKSGCFVFITSDDVSVPIQRYFTLKDPVTTWTVIEANKWVFLEYDTVVTESNINNTLRVGFYNEGTTKVQKFEMSGVYAYVNPALKGYIPYYVYQKPLNEIEVIDTAVSYIEGNSRLNILPYCEFADETINAANIVDTKGLNFSYAPCTNPSYENSVFATKNTELSHWYFVRVNNLLTINIGDTLQSGFWIKVKTTDNEPSTIRLYAGLMNMPNIIQNIVSDTWVFVINTMDVMAGNINETFKLGYYFTDGESPRIESIEMTALFAYVNKDIGKYIPYYTPILTRARRYTDEQLDNLNIKANTSKGGNISRFLSKVWTKHTSWNDVYRQSKIKVSLIGDSITESIQNNANSKIENVLEAQFPNVLFEYKHITFGGSSAHSMLAKVWEIINWNPDLVIYGEWEKYSQDFWDRHYLETIIRLFRNYSQTDIAIFAHSLRRNSCDKLVAGDITGYLNDESHRVRTTMAALSKKYGCEFMDFQKPAIEGLINGTYVTNDILIDVVHPTSTFLKIMSDVMKEHFVPFWQHENFANTVNVNQQKTYFLQEVATLSDLTEIKKSGTWIYSDGYMIKANADNSTIEIESDNVCGWELGYKNNGKSFSILIDGQKPSDIIPQYATFPSGNIFAHISKVSVIGKVLTESEFNRDFKLKIKTVTRDANAKLTGATFDLIDVATDTVIQANCNAFTDVTVDVNNGQIFIPYMYAGQRNIKDSGYDVNYPEPEVGNIIKINDEYDFSVKKNCSDIITPTNDNSIAILSIMPLKRGFHTLKITATNGAIFDYVMEY